MNFRQMMEWLAKLEECVEIAREVDEQLDHKPSKALRSAAKAVDEAYQDYQARNTPWYVRLFRVIQESKRDAERARQEARARTAAARAASEQEGAAVRAVVGSVLATILYLIGLDKALAVAAGVLVWALISDSGALGSTIIGLVTFGVGSWSPAALLTVLSIALACTVGAHLVTFVLVGMLIWAGSWTRPPVRPSWLDFQGKPGAHAVLAPERTVITPMPPTSAPAVQPTKQPSDPMTGESPEDWYARGVRYMDASDPGAAVAWFRRAAEAGHVKSQCNLGAMYDTGRGVSVDPAEALRWYSKAASAGHAKAQFNLGRLYDAGRGVPESSTEAAAWYRRAAEQGFDRAQVALARMYYDGRGVEANRARAMEWARWAANQGCEDASRWLSTLDSGQTR